MALLVVVLQAADTAVNATVETDGTRIAWGPYYINTTTGVIVFADSGFDISFARTTTGAPELPFDL